MFPVREGCFAYCSCGCDSADVLEMTPLYEEPYLSKVKRKNIHILDSQQMKRRQTVLARVFHVVPSISAQRKLVLPPFLTQIPLKDFLQILKDNLLARGISLSTPKIFGSTATTILFNDSTEEVDDIDIVYYLPVVAVNQEEIANAFYELVTSYISPAMYNALAQQGFWNLKDVIARYCLQNFFSLHDKWNDWLVISIGDETLKVDIRFVAREAVEYDITARSFFVEVDDVCAFSLADDFERAREDHENRRMVFDYPDYIFNGLQRCLKHAKSGFSLPENSVLEKLCLNFFRKNSDNFSHLVLQHLASKGKNISSVLCLLSAIAKSRNIENKEQILMEGIRAIYTHLAPPQVGGNMLLDVLTLLPREEMANFLDIVDFLPFFTGEEKKSFFGQVAKEMMEGHIPAIHGEKICEHLLNNGEKQDGAVLDIALQFFRSVLSNEEKMAVLLWAIRHKFSWQQLFSLYEDSVTETRKFSVTEVKILALACRDLFKRRDIAKQDVSFLFHAFYYLKHHVPSSMKSYCFGLFEDFLFVLSSNYIVREMFKILYSHLDLSKEEIENILSGEVSEIAARENLFLQDLIRQILQIAHSHDKVSLIVMKIDASLNDNDILLFLNALLTQENGEDLVLLIEESLLRRHFSLAVLKDLLLLLENKKKLRHLVDILRQKHLRKEKKLKVFSSALTPIPNATILQMLRNCRMERFVVAKGVQPVYLQHILKAKIFGMGSSDLDGLKFLLQKFEHNKEFKCAANFLEKLLTYYEKHRLIKASSEELQFLHLCAARFESFCYEEDFVKRLYKQLSQDGINKYLKLYYPRLSSMFFISYFLNMPLPHLLINQIIGQFMYMLTP